MRMVDLILKKRNNEELSKEEINYIISGYTKGEIPDYQVSALLMAIYFNGMTDEERLNLTLAMLKSGEEIDLSKIKGVKCDKHSTGGVGDKTSLVVAPLAAACGVKMAKMSGRGLGHTGGTLDKLEAIPGYDISLSEEEFVNQVNNIGIAVVGQTGVLAPADKKLYALRDVTGTVESIPLIASSIMSKKLASGADAICLDVKVGSGAFMKNIDDASKLATLMVQIGKNCGKDMTAILTNMEEPLGRAVGNSIEVIEAINTLNGNGPKDFHDLCIEVASHLVMAAKICDTKEEAITLLEQQIANKEGLKTLARLVEAQGGDSSYIFEPSKFIDSKYHIEVISKQSGYVTHIDALAIGNAAMMLGAGREKIGDNVDHSVGIILNKKVNDKIGEGESLATLYANKENVEEVINVVLNAYTIGKNLVDSQLILKIIK